jgi:glycosyltransferase involved in cell wall biosynthesis
VKHNILSEVVAAGYRRMATSSVCICALARDCAPALARNLPVVDALCAQFKRAAVVIVENDSKDESKEVLRTWAAGRAHIKLFLDDFGPTTNGNTKLPRPNPSFSRHRMERMVFHRNRYLDYALGIAGLEYVIVVDLDLYRVDIDGIAHAFGQTIPWDAQFANGRISDHCRPQFSDFYWDTYALWELGDNTPQTETKIASYFERLHPLAKGMPLLAVQSAFGGVAVYRCDALKGQRYTVEDNHDAQVEVVCDHVSLHRRMIAAGSRLFINPSMVVYYNRPRSRVTLHAARLADVLRRKGIVGATRTLVSRLASSRISS